MPTDELRYAPGQIVDGKVQGITNFGAFIELAPGTVGLVHISEIADTYVKDVKDFLKEGDAVKVKVLNVDAKKLGLSIKQAQPKPEGAARKPDASHAGGRPFGRDRNFHEKKPDRSREGGFDRERRREPRTGDAPRTAAFHKPVEPAPVTLDDKIARFLKESDDRQQPLKTKFEHKKRTRVN